MKDHIKDLKETLMDFEEVKEWNSDFVTKDLESEMELELFVNPN